MTLPSHERRVGLIGLAFAGILALVALSIWTPSAARAQSCQDSWTNTAGGSWFEDSNWSNKAPPTSTEEACITANGSYTVTLTSGGTVTVKSLTLGGESGTQSLVLGNATNQTLDFDATAALAVGAHGALTLTDGVGQNGQTGTLSVTGAASLGGTLAVGQAKTFKAKAGETFSVLSSPAVTGTFAKESGDEIGKGTGLYYKAVYSGTAVSLHVTQATVTLSSSSGPAGSKVTVSGTEWVPGDTLKLTFTDHKKHKTTLPSTTVNGAGEFSTEIAIPEGAAEGAGTIAVTSTDTANSISKAFTVN
jgi:hypothetical protein